MIKKIFWVSLGFFLLTLIFLGVYNFAFKNNTSNPIADPEKYAALQAEKETDIPTSSLAFEVFLNESVLFPKIEEKYLLYYSLRDKTLKHTTIDTKKSDTLFGALPGTVKRVLWSPVSIGALVLIEENQSSLWYYTDFRNQSITPLRKELSRLSWNTLGDGIYYIYTDPATGARSLNTASPRGENWRKLTDLDTNDYFVSTIPQSSQVAFWTHPDGLEESRLESISLTGEGRRLLLSGRYGGDYLWSPNSRSILISSVDTRGGSNPSLGIVDENGESYRDLLVPTFISKVTWSKDNQTIYYALPSAFVSGTTLPNDYFGKPIYTKDTFWKMNLKTGRRERLVPLNEIAQAFDATDLFLSPDETRLFFVDRSTNKLYSINL